MAERTLPSRFVHGVVATVVLAVGIGAVGKARAQALRDPTVVPAAVAASMHPAAAGAGKGDSQVMSVMVVDGRPFVISGSRRYALGDKLGQATVERISETQIWLREGRELRKINLYSGVQRQPHMAGKAGLGCEPGKRALTNGSTVSSHADRSKKLAGKRGESSVPMQDPACKNTTP